MMMMMMMVMMMMVAKLQIPNFGEGEAVGGQG